MIINDNMNGVRIDDHDKSGFIRWGSKTYGWGGTTAKQYEGVFEKVAEWIIATEPDFLKVTKVEEVRLNDEALRDIEVVSIREQNASIRRVVTVCGIIIGSWLAGPPIIQALFH